MQAGSALQVSCYRPCRACSRKLSFMASTGLLPCRASMGIGFTEGLVLPGREHVEPPKLFRPDKKDYGLSMRQMAALGLTDTDVARELEENEARLRSLL